MEVKQNPTPDWTKFDEALSEAQKNDRTLRRGGVWDSRDRLALTLLEAFYGPDFQNATGVEGLDNNSDCEWGDYLLDYKVCPFTPRFVEYCMRRFIADGYPPSEFMLVYLLGRSRREYDRAL